MVAIVAKCKVFYHLQQGCRIWHPNWVTLASNGINVGLFKISFSTFWIAEPKCTETDLKKSQICPIWGQSDPIWMPKSKNVLKLILKSLRFIPFRANRTQFGCRIWPPCLSGGVMTSQVVSGVGWHSHGAAWRHDVSDWPGCRPDRHQVGQIWAFQHPIHFGIKSDKSGVPFFYVVFYLCLFFISVP